MKTANKARHTLMLATLLACLLAAGCEKRQVRETRTFAAPAGGSLLTIAIDQSGSCAPLMADGGQGFAFLLRLVDSYFRAGIGSNDRLLLVQLSGNASQPLLWEGSPLALRRQFPSPHDLAAYLATHSDPSGSQIYSGVTRALRYAQSRHQAGSGQGKNAVVVLSDLVDSTADKREARRMLEAVADFSRSGGASAFYYVNQQVSEYLIEHLKEMGVEDYRVESEIVSQPPLPDWD